MKKKIFHSIITAVIAVLFVSIFSIMVYLYGYFNDLQEDQLRNELNWASSVITKTGEENLDILDDSAYRFTLIAEDGSILYDTETDYAEMENHLDREEIKEAFEHKRGSSVRYSSTLTEKTIYEAVRLDNGEVLRVSVSQKTVMSLLIYMLPHLVVVILLGTFISLIFADRMSRSIIEPLNSLDLEHPVQNDVYDELSPVLTRIERQNRRITKQVDILQQKTDEFEQIVSSMSEGLVLLDNGGKILSMNHAAMQIFSADTENSGREFLTIDRSPQMSKAVHEALCGNHSEFHAERNAKEYQFSVSPIQSGEKRLGAVILGFDITDKVYAERNRQEFTANVTHELKTPLQSIIGSAELLESGLVKPEDTGRFIGTIRKEAARLVTLINDIIRLSQLDENSEAMTEEVKLTEVAEEVIEVLSASAAKKNITIALEGEPCTIRGVRRYLYEIIYNLCDNAIRYNVENGKVTICTEKEKEHTVIRVSDTGIGIPPEHRARIFERFYRVDKSHSKETGGTGLGLSIVKHAVAYHGGEIALASEEGKGTTVTVIL